MAGSLIGALRVTLGLDSAAFEKGASATEKRAKSMERSISAAGQRMVGLGQSLSVAVTAPLVAMGVAAVRGAQAQAEAMGQVESALASMGDGANRTRDQLLKASDALELRSLYDGDEILRKVTANMLTFGNIAGTNFDRAQQAAVDLATRLGGDLQSSTLMLGKALNDPIKGLSALRRVGIQFTEQQQEQIKAMAAAGDTAGAQAVMLAELERQFGGAGAAAAKTAPWRQAQVALGQVGDTIGEVLLPFIERLANGVAALLTRFQGLSPGMQTFIVAAGAAAAALGPLMIGLGLAVKAMAPFLAVIGTISAAGGPLLAFKAGIAGLALAIGPVAPLLIALAGAVIWLNSQTENANTTIEGFNVTIGETDAFMARLRARAVEGGEGQKMFGGAVDMARGAMQRAAGDAQTLINQLYGVEAAAFAARRALAAQRMAQSWSTINEVNAERDRIAQPGLQWGPGGLNQGRSQALLKDRYNRAVSDLSAAQKDLDTMNADFSRRFAERGKAMVAPIAATAGAVRGLSRGMSANGGSARRAADEVGAAYQGLSDKLAPMLDRLFPEEAKARQYREDLAMIGQALSRNILTPLKAIEAQRRLALDGLPNTTLDKLLSENGERLDAETVLPFAVIQDRLHKLTGGLVAAATKSNVATVQISKSFKDMADDTIAALDRMVGAIKGGGFLNILSSVISMGLQLGSAGLFGKSVAANINAPRIPQYASGTSFHPGGMAMVGERGPELVNLPRGSKVFPNGTGPSTRVEVIPSPYFTVVVDGRVAQAAPAIAAAGAAMGAQRMAQASEWSLR